MTTAELFPPAAAEIATDLPPLPPHVHEFMAATEAANYPTSPSFILPEATDEALSDKTLRLGGQGLHLDAVAHDFLSHEGRLPPRFDFALQRARGFNAKRSAHQVFFGDITYQDSLTNEPAVQPVAIKWFEKGHNKALHEYMQLKSLAAKGFDVFVPAGILVTEHGEYLITHYEDALSTLDNENWAYMQSDPSERELMEGRLKDMAGALAELHVRGQTFHGDAKTRNTARTIDGSTNFIDFESAETVPDTTQWLAAFQKKAGADIMSLYKSLEENRGLFDTKKKPGLNGSERHSVFRQLFVDRYIASVAEHAADMPEAERRELARSLYAMQDDIYFGVFADWDRRRIPPAKRDPESTDPYAALGVSSSPDLPEAVTVGRRLALVEPRAPSQGPKDYRSQLQTKVINEIAETDAPDTGAREADIRTARLIGELVERSLLTRQ